LFKKNFIYKYIKIIFFIFKNLFLTLKRSKHSKYVLKKIKKNHTLNKQAAGRALLNRIICILLKLFGYSNFVSSLVESWIILIHFWLRVIFGRVQLNIRFFLGFYWLMNAAGCNWSFARKHLCSLNFNV